MELNKHCSKIQDVICLSYPYYSTYSARFESFLNWSALSNQSADNISAGGFFYTGELLYK